MNRKCLLWIFVVVILSVVLLNHATFSYGGDIFDPLCKADSRPPPADCTYQCQCECCPGVSTPGETREGYKHYKCKQYSKRCGTKWVGPKETVSTQPDKLPSQFFTSAYSKYENTATCNQGSDVACCCYDGCYEYELGTKIGRWGDVEDTSTCISKYYKVVPDLTTYHYANSWDENELPNHDYDDHCTVYKDLPTPGTVTIKCEHQEAEFKQYCYRYYTSADATPLFDACKKESSEPACPDDTSASCAASCAAAIAAGTVVCPP